MRKKILLLIEKRKLKNPEIGNLVEQLMRQNSVNLLFVKRLSEDIDFTI